MSIEEKIGQLFCALGKSTDTMYLEELLSFRIGGVMFRPRSSEEIYNAYAYMQTNSRIPLLLASNIENGGIGVTSDGTNFGRELQVAATDEEIQAYRLGYVSCRECKALGGNWAFAPVADVDLNFRNPITNVRTFGRDVERVINMSRAYLKGAREVGIATAVKHFPGDGVDERDQHLHTTINTLSVEQWNNTYGRIYKELIRAGTKTIMVGHIALPQWAKKIKEI